MNGELNRIAFHRERNTNVQNIDGQVLETELYCIPEQSVVVTISFTVSSPSAAKIFFDNVELELWDNSGSPS